MTCPEGTVRTCVITTDRVDTITIPDLSLEDARQAVTAWLKTGVLTVGTIERVRGSINASDLFLSVPGRRDPIELAVAPVTPYAGEVSAA